MENQGLVIVMRGCPGAGKSYFLKESFPGAFVCSANDFFTDEVGNYSFVGESVPKSHEYCRAVFKMAIRKSFPLIAVDNTAIKLWEFEEYVEIAKRHGYQVKVIRIDTDPQIAAARNIHGVSEEKVLKLYEGIESYEEEIVMN